VQETVQEAAPEPEPLVEPGPDLTALRISIAAVGERTFPKITCLMMMALVSCGMSHPFCQLRM
jgi:hypothetical protein